MTQSQRFVVASDEAPVRLDVFLRGRLAGVSRSYVQKAIDEGHVSVGNRRRAKGYLLSPGDEVTLEGFVRPEDRALSSSASLVVPVVHEDPDFLVLDKPPLQLGSAASTRFRGGARQDPRGHRRRVRKRPRGQASGWSREMGIAGLTPCAEQPINICQANYSLRICVARRSIPAGWKGTHVSDVGGEDRG